MAKPKKKYEKPLHLDMPFDEALQRYAHTDPRELKKQPAKKRKKRKTLSRSSVVTDRPEL